MADPLSQPALTVRVPATTANLGSGFDCLGMALDLWATARITPVGAPGPTIEGDGDTRRAGELVWEGLAAVQKVAKAPWAGARIAYDSEIPVGRGLGASAAARAAGLVAGREFCGGKLSDEELIRLGSKLEGHPDNIAAALLGSCQVVVEDGERIVTAEVPVPEELRVVLLVPDFEMPTDQTRRALPDPVARRDAVFNLGRAALLVAALTTGRLDLLRVATQDRLHQPARQRYFPAMDAILGAALEAGALGAFLSGGGPTVLAFCAGKEQEVGQAMRQAALEQGVRAEMIATRPTRLGAHVVSWE